MNIEICKDSYTFIWDQHIPLNAWYGCDASGWWFCTVHARPEDNDNTLELRRFNGSRWVRVRESSDTTQAICQWASSKNVWWTKCHWFKDEDRQKSFVTKLDKKHDDIKQLMSHSRKHKKSSMGIRLDKENFYANKTFTDYSQYDFKRYYV